jgi:hypothetical protein
MRQQFDARAAPQRSGIGAGRRHRRLQRDPGMTTIRVVHSLNDIEVSDGDLVAPALIPRALTAGELVFSDHATQVFEADGGTTYVENGRPTRGEWYVDDEGHFGSFWPPSYRASYELRWIVEDGAIVGLRFTELGRGSRFDGRYRD